MSGSVVECPDCSTLFRITVEQLSAASGQVRCGACLTIFHAADNWAPEPVPGSDPGSDPGSGKLGERAHEEDSDRLQARRHRSVLDAPTPERVPARRRRGAGSAQSTAAADRQPLPVDAAGAAAPAREAPATIPMLVAAPDSAGGAPEETSGPGAADAALDTTSDTPSDTTSDTASDTASDTGFDPDGFFAHRRFRAAPTGRGRSAATDADAAFPVVQIPEPEPPAGGVRMRLWRWRWSLAALLLLSLAGGRWLSVNFESLALAPESRGYLARLCDVVGCELPVRVDMAAIRSQRLHVGVDPDRPEALRAELVLINRAEWPQPFPDLELRFSTIRGEAVASERFTPAEYLAGELTGAREMPPGSPIRIALQLADPGSEAVNYELRLRPSGE